MTTNEVTPQPEVDNNVVGAGELLRQARVEKGLTQHEVASQLNLRLAVIESIDNEQNSAGVEPTFLRGYVKAYAKLIGLSETKVLAAFDKKNGPITYDTMAMQSFSKKTRQQANDNWLKRISWLVFFGLIASLVFWWWQDSQNRSAAIIDNGAAVTDNGTAVAENSQNDSTYTEFSATDELATTPAIDESKAPSVSDVTALTDAHAPEVDTEQAANEPVAHDELMQDEAREAAVNEVSPEGNFEDNQTTAVAANPELISLSFTDDCWIQVTDSTGNVLSSGIKGANQSLELEGKPPFSLVLGVPQAAKVVYMNKPVDLSVFKAGRTARLTVPKPD